jgi:hypothetical protein
MSLARRVIIGNFFVSALFAMIWCGSTFVSDIKHWNQVSRDHFRAENMEVGLLFCMLLEGGLVAWHIYGYREGDTDGPRKTALFFGAVSLVFFGIAGILAPVANGLKIHWWSYAVTMWVLLTHVGYGLFGRYED